MSQPTRYLQPQSVVHPRRVSLKTVASGLALLLAMGLSGCSSSSSGPDRSQVFNALMRMGLRQHGYPGGIAEEHKILAWRKKHLYQTFRVQKCEKSGVSQWTCMVYRSNPNVHNGAPFNRQEFSLTHVDHKWRTVPGSFRNY